MPIAMTRLVVVATLLLLPILCTGCGEDPPPAPKGQDSFARLQESVNKLGEPDPAPAPAPAPEPEPAAPVNRASASVAEEETAAGPAAQWQRGNVHRIEVTAVNLDPPSIYAGIDIKVNPNIRCPEGADVQCRYLWYINGEPVEDVHGAILPGALFKRDDKITVNITPFDDEGDGPVFVSTPLIIPNGPPVIVSQPPQEMKNNRYVYPVKAEDPDGDPVTYSVEGAPPGMEIDAETGMLTWEFSEKAMGDYRVKVIATDPGGLKSSQEYNMNLSLAPSR